MSPGSAHSVPAVDGVQTGQLLDETAADLALRATRYLRTRFRERVTIGDLSAHLAYSPSRLTRVFTSVVGTSPMDYLAAWRLHEAKHLLITHRLGVAETCHEVGYTSVGTFSRRFLRDVGTPPGALRGIADSEMGEDKTAIQNLRSADEISRSSELYPLWRGDQYYALICERQKRWKDAAKFFRLAWEASDKTDTQLKEQLERAEDRVGKKRGGIGSFLGGIVNGVLSVAGALVGIG